MPEIGLANDVNIEYDEGLNAEDTYRFTTDISRIGDFAQEGVDFAMLSRREEDSNFVYTFKTETNYKFDLFESAFYNYMDEGKIIKIED